MKKLVNVLMTLVLCCTIFLNGSLSVNATGASAEVDMEDFVAQGQELFEEFLEVSAFIESDSSWNDCLYVYNKVRRISGGQIYLESVGDASQEVWDSLSAYEVLVYYDTYLSFASMANAVNTVNYDSYVADEEHGVAEFVKIAVLGWNGNDSDKGRLNIIAFTTSRIILSPERVMQKKRTRILV